MNALPWLVVHGAAVWRAALAIFVLGAMALAWLRPRVLARRAARLARADLGWPTDVADASPGKRVTLAGRLELHPERWLHTDDVAVRLDGDLRVLAGSREAWPGGVLEAQTIASGDLARVRGLLDEEAADEATTYRDAAKRRVLRGALEVAFEGAPRVEGMRASALAKPAAIGLTLFLAIFGVGGEIARSEAVRSLVAYEVGPVAEPPRAMAFAAASPFRRAEALALLAEALDARQDPDPDELVARAELHELLGERAPVAAMWIEHGEPERGARLAAELDDGALAARGYYAAGDFERASWALEDSTSEKRAEPLDLRFAVGVHLLAGRLDRAVRAAQVLAAALRDKQASSPPGALAAWYDNRATIATCLATALSARAGGAASGPTFHDGQGADLPRSCALLSLDLLEGPARTRAMSGAGRSHGSGDAYDVPVAWFDLLAAEAEPNAPDATAPAFDSAAEVLAVPNGVPLALAVPAIERQLAETLPSWPKNGLRGPRTRQRRVCAAASVFAYLTGDRPAAQRLARASYLVDGIFAAGAFGDAEEAPRAMQAAALPDDARPAEQAMRWMQVLGGDDFLHGLSDYVVDHDATALLQALVDHPPPDEDEKEAWWLAAGGDGARLARWLRRPRSQPGTFLRYGAPLLRTGRAEVARWIRWGQHPQMGFHPVEDAVHLATLADAAASLGDAETAAALGERARRFREAVLTRATAVPLAVLDWL